MPTCPEKFRRIFTLIGHLPWLARFMMLISRNTNDLQNMRKDSFARVIARKKKGTEQKDLFYYLVGIRSSLIPLYLGFGPSLIASTV